MENLKINSEQKKAILHLKGPLLVVAGAGTGKTTVITQKIRYLITKKKVKPEQILALTFSEKAAGEMLKRIDEVMPLGYEEPWLSTFHAFCDRILKTEALEIGLNPAYKILSGPQQWLLIRKHLFDFNLDYYRPLGNPTKFISALLQLFSRAKDEMVTAEEFLSYAQKKSQIFTDDAEKEENVKLLEVALAYKKYQELLLENNALDFGDLLMWTIHLFKKRPSILKRYQKQFCFLLIDEFQDTNLAQFEIIKLLAPALKNPNLTVVGDDDQSIYKFRGAAISNILGFKKLYKKTETIVLTKNYRSTQKILDASYNLIQNNNPERLEKKLHIEKKLKSLRNISGADPVISSLPTMEQEADYVAEKIKELGESGKYNFADFAILARANNHLDAFVACLRRHGIPYSLIGNRGLFNQEEIRSVMAFLRFLINEKDSSALYQLLIYPAFNIDSNIVSGILNTSRENKISLWESLSATSKNDSVYNLQNIIEKLREKLHSRTVTQILYEFLTTTNFIKSLLTDETVENALKIKNINLFFEKVKSFETQTVNPNIYEFVDYLDLLIEAGDNPAQAEIEDIDTVKLLTVHSAKGLEFPVVFLVNLTSDRFPSRERSDPLPLPLEIIKEKLPIEDFHLPEERRLFYVGMTRAKDLLILSWAKNYGGVREKKPSVFLHELGIDIPLRELSTGSSQVNLFTQTTFDLIPAPKVMDIKPLKNGRLSYSQIETFKTCPLKYYYKYVIGVVGQPSSALNFGQVLHRTLRDFHKNDLFNQTANLNNLLESYKTHFNELSQGYTSIEHRVKSFKHGQELLEKYFQKQKGLFARPVLLEQRFRIKVGNIILIGAIDRIDQYEDKHFEVIDYKTGGGEEKEKKVDQDEQLTIYAMAAEEALNIKPQDFTLYFLERGVKATTQRTKEDIEKQKEEIISIVSEIKKGKFPAKVGMWCRWCEFNKICPAYNAGKNNF